MSNSEKGVSKTYSHLLVLVKEGSELGEDTHMCPLQAKITFQKADDLLKVAAALERGDEGAELLSMNNNVETTDFGLARE